MSANAGAGAGPTGVCQAKAVTVETNDVAKANMEDRRFMVLVIGAMILIRRTNRINRFSGHIVNPNAYPIIRAQALSSARNDFLR